MNNKQTTGPRLVKVTHAGAGAEDEDEDFDTQDPMSRVGRSGTQNQCEGGIKS